MGVFGDIGRLMKAGLQSTARTDYAENLRQSADLAEAYSAGTLDGTHGAAGANPFENMNMYASMDAVAGTVLSLERTFREVQGVPVYSVELEIEADGRPPYRTRYETLIAAGAKANWQPGKVLPFRVSKTDPHQLMLG
ncbi:hypothetical protein [Pseudoclavibacter helvolus]|nr:hypothetical protein [Pseudoclavibacter helvolus]